MPAFVLLSAEDYERLSAKRSIVEWLQMDSDIEFEPERVDSLPTGVDVINPWRS